MITVNNDPTHRLPQRQLERRHHQLLRRRLLRRRRRPRVGPRLHRVHLRPDLPVAVRCAQRVLLRRLGRDRRPDQRPPGRGRGRHRRQASRRPVLARTPRALPLADDQRPGRDRQGLPDRRRRVRPAVDRHRRSPATSSSRRRRRRPTPTRPARRPTAARRSPTRPPSRARSPCVDRGTLRLRSRRPRTPRPPGAAASSSATRDDAALGMSGADDHRRSRPSRIGLTDRESIRTALAGGATVNVTMKDAGGTRVRLLPLADRREVRRPSAARSATCGTPPATATRARCRDAEYKCSADDNGGVHGNSGVPNHAYALLVDGGTYNGVDRHRHRPRQGRQHLLAGADRPT